MENKLVMHMKKIKETRILDAIDEAVSITFIFEDNTEETGVIKADEFKKLIDEQQGKKGE